MKTRKRYQAFCAFAVVFILTVVSGYGQTGKGSAESSGAVNPFASFRDVPGITTWEIAAIEALQRERWSFSFGVSPSTEAFVMGNDEVGGFTALFCQWLTGFFGIRFWPEILTFNDLIAGVTARTIDFAGNMTPTPERLRIYFMTDPIVERRIKMMRLRGSPSLDQIAKQRPPRYALSRNSIIQNLVIAGAQPGTYVIVDVYNIDEAYQTLLDGLADAFIDVNTAVDGYPAPDVYTELYFPLVDGYPDPDEYTKLSFPLVSIPVSMATANPDLEAVISVVNKALRNGAVHHINYLNNLGYENYQKERFFSMLTAEERAYLQYTGPVPIAARHSNYPVAFYNTRERRWEGIAFDVLTEVGKLSGLTFTVANNQNTEYDTLLEMLYDGNAHIFPDLPYSEMPDGRFLRAWNNFMAESAFVFNREQEVLCSIVDKALLLINTNTIVEKWVTN